MNDNTVCCQNRELTEPAGETACPYDIKWCAPTPYVHPLRPLACHPERSEVLRESHQSGESSKTCACAGIYNGVFVTFLTQRNISKQANE